ncbi:MAG: hypothetical protein HW405_295 [Candidatus Berkelbacteria bacterium]|nr:hypothetical protein [Candidatus Berkelbacteria bacterium]
MGGLHLLQLRHARTVSSGGGFLRPGTGERHRCRRLPGVRLHCRSARRRADRKPERGSTFGCRVRWPSEEGRRGWYRDHQGANGTCARPPWHRARDEGSSRGGYHQQLLNDREGNRGRGEKRGASGRLDSLRQPFVAATPGLQGPAGWCSSRSANTTAQAGRRCGSHRDCRLIARRQAGLGGSSQGNGRRRSARHQNQVGEHVFASFSPGHEVQTLARACFCLYKHRLKINLSV